MNPDNIEYYTSDNEMNDDIDNLLSFKNFLDTVLTTIKLGKYNKSMINKMSKHIKNFYDDVNSDDDFTSDDDIESDSEPESDSKNDYDTNSKSDNDVLQPINNKKDKLVDDFLNNNLQLSNYYLKINSNNLTTLYY